MSGSGVIDSDVCDVKRSVREVTVDGDDVDVSVAEGVSRSSRKLKVKDISRSPMEAKVPGRLERSKMDSFKKKMTESKAESLDELLPGILRLIFDQ